MTRPVKQAMVQNTVREFSRHLVLAVRGQKRGEGRGRERRKRDLAKYESKRALIG